VIFGWQTYPQSCYTGTAVSPLYGARCTTRKTVPSPVRITTDCLKGKL
jgi:hypothetical protein